MNRRHALALLASSPVVSALPIVGMSGVSSTFTSAFAQDRTRPPLVPIITWQIEQPDWLKGLIEGIKDLAKSPIGQAAIGLTNMLGFVGFFSQQMFEQEVRSRLHDVLVKLEEIDRKVTEILSILHGLDSIIQRNLERHAKDELRVKIAARTAYVQDVLSKYISSSSNGFELASISQQDRLDLQVVAREILLAGYELGKWGPDSFLAITQSYATYELVSRVLGGDGYRGATRARVVGEVATSQSFFAATESRLSTEYLATKRDLDRFPKRIYYGGNTFGSSGSSCRFTNYYGTISGTFESGYGHGDWSIESEGHINARTYAGISAGQLPGLPNFAPTIGDDNQLKSRFYQTMAVMNSHRSVAQDQKSMAESASIMSRTSFVLQKVLQREVVI